MRAVFMFVLFIWAFFPSPAWAELADGSFDVGSWHGSAVNADGSFAFCSMFGLFGRNTAPLALAIALNDSRGWTLAISSDRLTSFPLIRPLATNDCLGSVCNRRVDRLKWCSPTTNYTQAYSV